MVTQQVEPGRADLLAAEISELDATARLATQEHEDDADWGVDLQSLSSWGVWKPASRAATAGSANRGNGRPDSPTHRLPPPPQPPSTPQPEMLPLPTRLLTPFSKEDRSVLLDADFRPPPGAASAAASRRAAEGKRRGGASTPMGPSQAASRALMPRPAKLPLSPRNAALSAQAAAAERRAAGELAGERVGMGPDADAWVILGHNSRKKQTDAAAAAKRPTTAAATTPRQQQQQQHRHHQQHHGRDFNQRQGDTQRVFNEYVRAVRLIADFDVSRARRQLSTVPGAREALAQLEATRRPQSARDAPYKASSLSTAPLPPTNTNGQFSRPPSLPPNARVPRTGRPMISPIADAPSSPRVYAQPSPSYPVNMSARPMTTRRVYAPPGLARIGAGAEGCMTSGASRGGIMSLHIAQYH